MAGRVTKRARSGNEVRPRRRDMKLPDDRRRWTSCNDVCRCQDCPSDVRAPRGKHNALETEKKGEGEDRKGRECTRCSQAGTSLGRRPVRQSRPALALY